MTLEIIIRCPHVAYSIPSIYTIECFFIVVFKFTICDILIATQRVEPLSQEIDDRSKIELRVKGLI